MAPMLKREAGKIDWAWRAEKIYNRMRGFTPWPGAYTSFRGSLCHIWGRPAEAGAAVLGSAEPGTLRVISGELYVACGEGTWLRAEGVQREGRKRVTAKEFLSGARLEPDECFGGV
jgi:methionyl-tRNA formyltransferase